MPQSKAIKNVVTKITADAGTGIANIRIVDYIGTDTNNGASMRQVVDEMLSKGIKDAEVYLNTQGGNVFEATEIVNQLARFSSVKIYAGALVASAGTYITSKFYTVARKNTQIMVHKPSMFFGGNEDQVQQQMKLLANLTNDYRDAYIQKTAMSSEEIDEIWAKGDYWMNAQEALDKGFIDEMILEEIEVSDSEIALMQACGAPSIPVQTKVTAKQIQTNNNSKMERLQLIAALGLAADATDEQISAAIAANKQKADAFEAQAKAAESLRKLKAKKLAEAAHLAKKISADEVPLYITLAEANYDEVEKVLDMKAPVPKLSAHLNAQLPAAVQNARAAWTLEDYLEKDPEAFAALEDTDPETFKRLNDAYFKSGR